MSGTQQRTVTGGRRVQRGARWSGLSRAMRAWGRRSVGPRA